MSNDKNQGGAMGGVDELYREVILDHFKAPKNRGVISGESLQAEGKNPLCGDQISMSAIIDGNVLKNVMFEGHGCAISQSAASMLTELMKGKTVSDLTELIKTYKAMFHVENANDPTPSKYSLDDLGDLISLEGVKKYPVRIKCALLSANVLMELLIQHERKKS